MEFVIGGMGIKDTKGEQSVENPCKCGAMPWMKLTGCKVGKLGLNIPYVEICVEGQSLYMVSIIYTLPKPNRM